MTAEEFTAGIISGEIERLKNNAEQVGTAAQWNGRSLGIYYQAMQNYFLNLRRHQDNPIFVPLPERPEVPRKWLAVPTPGRVDYFMVVQSPSERVCEPIGDPLPAPPPAPGTAKVGELVGGNNADTQNWRYVGLGDTIPVDGIASGPDGKDYRKIQIGKAGSGFGASFYYAPL